jgi:putative transposase
MPHTYAQNVIHVVFSTKERRKDIPEQMQTRLWEYTAAICKNVGILVHAIGGTEDHIHLLIQIPPSLAVAKAVASIKANSSRWAREAGQKFEWQEGYGAFSVSHSLLPAAVRYVRNQKAHHKKMGFDAEFVALLKKHAIEFDSKYVFG